MAPLFCLRIKGYIRAISKYILLFKNMTTLYPSQNQIAYVTNFQDLVSTPFRGEINAFCWSRQLIGDFAEIVHKAPFNENITELKEDRLLQLQLSEEGQLAREILLNDLKLLRAHGASPTLNLIKYYERMMPIRFSLLMFILFMLTARLCPPIPFFARITVLPVKYFPMLNPNKKCLSLKYVRSLKNSWPEPKKNLNHF